MDPVKLARKIFSSRYGLLNTPVVRSPGFLSLIRGTRHLIDITTKTERSEKSAKSFAITFQKGASAFTDEHLNVRIPAWYCYIESLEKFVGRPLTDAEATAISVILINGSSIHEGLHVAHSRKLFTPTFKTLIKEYANEQLFDYLLNVTEDLKNEASLEMPHKSDLFEFVNAKNEIFFSENNLLSTIEKAFERYGEEDVKSIALEILVFTKCISRRERVYSELESFGLSNVVELLNQAVFHTSDSFWIANELYKIFVSTEASKNKTRMSQEAENAAAKEIEKIAESDKKTFDSVNEEKEMVKGGIQSLVEFDILSNPKKMSYYSYSDDEVEISAKFGFIKKLKVSRQVMPTLREPKTRGNTLVNTRISRIATDGKIFSSRGESVASVQKKQPEFIILGDFSGSMWRIIGEVNETIRKMAKAMLEVGVTFAVYGHTSYDTDTAKDVPVVYHIFSNRTNGRIDSNLDARFDAVKEVRLQENYDGFAIKHVSQKFNRSAQSKVLIVISDGAPAGPGYDDGREHTKKMIEEARRNGIKVISISLTADVMGENDRIYGKTFNVDATSQSKLENGMQRIIMGG